MIDTKSHLLRLEKKISMWSAVRQQAINILFIEHMLIL